MRNLNLWMTVFFFALATVALGAVAGYCVAQWWVGFAYFPVCAPIVTLAGLHGALDDLRVAQRLQSME